MIKAIYINAKDKSLNIIPFDEKNYKDGDGYWDVRLRLGYVPDFNYKNDGKIFCNESDYG